MNSGQQMNSPTESAFCLLRNLVVTTISTGQYIVSVMMAVHGSADFFQVPTALLHAHAASTATAERYGFQQGDCQQSIIHLHGPQKMIRRDSE
jgi:hypothetical protein